MTTRWTRRVFVTCPVQSVIAAVVTHVCSVFVRVWHSYQFPTMQQIGHDLICVLDELK